MSDIDFDELDKAVNTALGSTPDASPAPTATQSVVSEPTTSSDTQADETPVVPVTPPVQPVPRTPLASPAAKRSGRFMDMVHPSSDMANETPARVTPKLKIVPSANFEKETAPVSEQPDEPTVDVETPTPVIDTNPPTAVDTMPDPLDVLAAADKAEESPVLEPETVEPKVDDASDVETSDDTADSVEEPAKPDVDDTVTVPVASEATPFLSDAKVEKRPLGGFGQADQPVAADEQLSPEPTLPESLQSDIVAVESASVPSESFSTAADESAHLKVTPEADEPTPVVANAPQTPSIPQQYQSAPSEMDETPHSVFDTDQYHQPMITEHATHSGSRTWVFVLIIVALLVVGAALGYFAFMSGL